MRILKRATPYVKRNIRLYCHLQGPVALTPVADSKRLAKEQMEHRSLPYNQWWSCNYIFRDEKQQTYKQIIIGCPLLLLCIVQLFF